MTAEWVTVQDLSHDGRGVARGAGKAVFVAGGLAGEQVRIRVTRRRRSYDEAQLLEVLTPSPERRAPRCPHFGRCGGCQLQHLAAAGQRRARQRWLMAALERLAGLVPDRVLPPVAGPAWGYRRRARLALVRERGVPRLGFRQAGSQQVAPIRVCPILVPSLEALLPDLTELAGALVLHSVLTCG